MPQPFHELVCVVKISYHVLPPSLPPLPQNSNLTQVADSIAQLTESSDDLDANDVGIIADFVDDIATEATQNEEVRTLAASSNY